MVVFAELGNRRVRGTLVIGWGGKLVVGLGKFGLVVGPYASINVAAGVTLGSALQAGYTCRASELDLSLKYGVGFAIPGWTVAALNSALGFFGFKPVSSSYDAELGTLPNLPAVQDTIPDFEAYEWNGVFVPTGTSPEIVKKLNAGLNEVLRQPDIVARFKSLNIDFKENTPQEFRSFVATETEKWGKVVRDAGIKLGS